MKPETEKRISNKDVPIDMADLKKLTIDKALMAIQAFKKRKIYTQRPPPGRSLVRGPRGGMYYDDSVSIMHLKGRKMASTKEGRQKQVHIDQEKKIMNQFLKGVGYQKPKETFSGKYSENKDSIIKAYTKHLNNYSEFIDGTTNSLIKGFVDGLTDNFTDIDAQNAFDISVDAVDKLIYQEMRSWERQLGDHGIRHIEGNIRMFNSIVDDMNLPDKDVKLIGYITMLNHDIGYTTQISRESIEGTKYHKEFSEVLFKNDQKLYKDILGDKFNEVQEYVLKHDIADISWKEKPILAAISVADNLALFHREKLPTLFKKVPSGLFLLFEMQKGLADKDEKRFKKAQAQIKTNIDKMFLPEYTKYLLRKASDEISPYTPKVTISMLAGEVGKIKWQKEKGLDIEIKTNSLAKELNKLFDQGQKKFIKFAEAFGIDNLEGEQFEFKNKKENILSVHTTNEAII